MNNNDFLQHYGVKGMKWGVRRYQNADGTLTEAGKQRYKAHSGYIKIADKDGAAYIKREHSKNPYHDFTIQKGSTITRYSSEKESKVGNFAVVSDWDKKEYQQFAQKGQLFTDKSTEKYKQISIKALDDISVMSGKKSVEIIMNHIKETDYQHEHRGIESYQKLKNEGFYDLQPWDKQRLAAEDENVWNWQYDVENTINGYYGSNNKNLAKAMVDIYGKYNVDAVADPLDITKGHQTAMFVLNKDKFAVKNVKDL